MATTTLTNAKPLPYFDPLSVTGCILWIDANDASTITTSGGIVSTVLDKSKRNNHLIGGVGFSYNVTKFNSTYPSFYNVSNNTARVGRNTAFSRAQPMTIFVIGQFVSGTSSFPYLFDGVSSRVAFYYTSAAGGATSFFGGSGFGVTPTAFFIYSLVANTTSSQIYLNGTLGQSGNLGTNSMGGVTLGNAFDLTNSFTGHICEYLIYDNVVGSTQRQQIEGYLAWKWGLQTNLSTSHPFRTTPPTPFPQLFLPEIIQNVRPLPYFNPTILGNCSLWLDAGDASTITLSGSSVTQWRDKSGNSRNASGGVSPTFSNFGVVFNGSQYLTTAYSSVPSRETVFVVATITGTTNAKNFFMIGNTGVSNSRGFTVNLTSGVYTICWDRSAVARYAATPGVQNGVRFLATGVYTGSSGATALNGGSQTSASFSFSGSGTTVIGAVSSSVANTSWIGTINEIICFTSQMVASQYQQVEGYLAWKWSLQTNLPSNHPFKNGPPAPSTVRLAPPISTRVARWLPTQVSNCILWLDGGDRSRVGVSGTSVTAWNDKSGLNNNLTTISSPAPTYSASTGAITFTAADGINTGTSIRGALNQSYTNPISTFIVCSIRLDPNAIYNPRLINFGTDGSSATYFAGQLAVIPNAFTGSTPGLCIYANNGEDTTGIGINNQTYIPTTFSTVGIFENISNYSGTTLTLNTFLNGNTSTYSSKTTSWTVSAPYVTSMSYVALGTNTNGSTYVGDDFSGDMYEVVVFSRSLSVTERQQVEGYLAWKWKLVANLPSTHPFKLFPPSP